MPWPPALPIPNAHFFSKRKRQCDRESYTMRRGVKPLIGFLFGPISHREDSYGLTFAVSHAD